MNWLAPGAFWWLALALPVTALFFYHRRSTTRDVPSLEFWELLPRPAAVRFFGRYLSNIPMLLVALALLALLVTALAGPTLPRQASAELIIVLDTAAPMQTLEEGGTTRFELARRAALSRVRAAADDTLFSLVAAGPTPRVLASHTADRTQMKAALASVTSSDTDSDLAAAVDLAVALCTVGRRTEIHLLTGAAGSALPAPNDPPPGVVMHRLGRTHSNVGIAGLSNPEGTQTLQVALVSSAGHDGDVTVTVSKVDDAGDATATLASASATLTAERATVMLPCRLAPGVPFRVDVAPSDALPLDNVAWGVWPKDPSVRVQLVTEGNVFLRSALAPMPSTTLRIVLPRRWKPDPTADVTIFDRFTPPSTAPAPGRYLCFGCADPFGWVSVDSQAVRHDPLVTHWSVDHAALTDVELESWQVRQTAGLLAPPGAQSIAAADDTPLLFEVRPAPGAGSNATAPDTLAMYFNFTIGDSNLALRPTFPVLLWNTLDYLLQRAEAPGMVAHPTGAPLLRPRHTLQAPSMTVPLLRRSRPLATHGERWIWTDTGRQGLYRLRSAGRDDEWIACNWMPSPQTPAAPAGTTAAPSAKATPNANPPTRWAAFAARLGQPWRLLCVILLAGLLTEWLLFNRRILKM